MLCPLDNLLTRLCCSFAQRAWFQARQTGDEIGRKHAAACTTLGHLGRRPGTREGDPERLGQPRAHSALPGPHSLLEQQLRLSQIDQQEVAE